MSKYKYNFIYKITNLLSGKMYVGLHSTDNLDDGYFGSGVYLKNAIKKHGKENFQLEIIEHTTEELIFEREIYWISKLNTLEEGYNLTKGGEGILGFVHNEDTKERLCKIGKLQFDTIEKRKAHSILMSEIMDNPIIKDKISIGVKKYITEEVRNIMSIRMKELTDTEEWKEKHSKVMKEWNKNNKEWRESHNEFLKELWNEPSRKEYARIRALQQFEDPIQIENARERAKGNESHAKHYLMFYDNIITEIKNLSKYVRDNDINSYFLNRIMGDIDDEFDDLKDYKGIKIKRLYIPNTKNIKEAMKKANIGKYYKLTFEDGSIITIKNLKKYCIDNNFSYSCMLRVSRGIIKSYRGMIIEKVDSPIDNK